MGELNCQWTTMAWYYYFILSVSIFSSSEGFLLSSNDICEKNVYECARLFSKLQDALLGDEANKFQMRQAFFHSPAANPVLLRVIYNVTVTAEKVIRAENQYTGGGEAAGNDSGKSCSAIELKQEGFTHTYGWTSTGVYTVFHPMVLYMMQTQVTFVALKCVHYLLQEQRSLAANTFLWDGNSSDLPTLHLNLNINNSSQNIFETVLTKINTLVSKAKRKCVGEH